MIILDIDNELQQLADDIMRENLRADGIIPDMPDSQIEGEE